jgi:methanogenic corrinoid protein MtbC1
LNTLNELSRAIGDYDNASAAKWAAAALSGGVEPSEALTTVAETMAEIGEGFSSGELWLPDLIAAAEAGGRKASLQIAEERAQKLPKNYQPTLPADKDAELDRILEDARRHYQAKGLI